jgi:hypothetical protein
LLLDIIHPRVLFKISLCWLTVSQQSLFDHLIDALRQGRPPLDSRSIRFGSPQNPMSAETPAEMLENKKERPPALPQAAQV